MPSRHASASNWSTSSPSSNPLDPVPVLALANVSAGNAVTVALATPLTAKFSFAAATSLGSISTAVTRPNLGDSDTA